MALDDITLNDGVSTPVAHVFEYVGTEANRVIRKDMAAPVEEPLTLTMAHKKATLDGKPGNSHLVRFDQTTLDADGITPYRDNIRVMVDFHDASLTDAKAKNFAAFVRNILTEAFILSLVRGSVG